MSMSYTGKSWKREVMSNIEMFRSILKNDISKDPSETIVNQKESKYSASINRGKLSRRNIRRRTRKKTPRFRAARSKYLDYSLTAPHRGFVSSTKRLENISNLYQHKRDLLKDRRRRKIRRENRRLSQKLRIMKPTKTEKLATPLRIRKRRSRSAGYFSGRNPYGFRGRVSEQICCVKSVSPTDNDIDCEERQKVSRSKSTGVTRSRKRSKKGGTKLHRLFPIAKSTRTPQKKVVSNVTLPSTKKESEQKVQQEAPKKKDDEIKKLKKKDNKKQKKNKKTSKLHPIRRKRILKRSKSVDVHMLRYQRRKPIVYFTTVKKRSQYRKWRSGLRKVKSRYSVFFSSSPKINKKKKGKGLRVRKKKKKKKKKKGKYLSVKIRSKKKNKKLYEDEQPVYFYHKKDEKCLKIQEIDETKKEEDAEESIQETSSRSENAKDSEDGSSVLLKQNDY